jgi:hypothetical protein
MDTKGFFINSSFKRKRLLKALFHCPANKAEDREKEEEDFDYPQPPFNPGQKDAWTREQKGQMYKVMSL